MGWLEMNRVRDEDDAECLWIRETVKEEEAEEEEAAGQERGKGDQQRIISSHQRTNNSRKKKENEEAQALKALRVESDATKHRFNKSRTGPPIILLPCQTGVGRT